MRENGFENVFHLEGGILKYLEEVPAEESLWNGECFVFDNRVTVDQSLHKGSYEQCHACRTPISEEDKLNQDFTKGVSCPHCIETKTDHDRSRFEERQKQINLAAQRKETHVGEEAREDQKIESEKKKNGLRKYLVNMLRLRKVRYKETNIIQRGKLMSWGFDTDPEFQGVLDWAAEFVEKSCASRSSFE